MGADSVDVAAKLKATTASAAAQQPVKAKFKSELISKDEAHVKDVYVPQYGDAGDDLFSDKSFKPKQETISTQSVDSMYVNKADCVRFVF